MCFSATASFTSGVILAVAGVVSVKQAQKSPETLFAAIPLIFSIQQFIEGFLWLTLKGKMDPQYQTILSYAFIFIAQVIWPFWVPLSISLLEKKPERKKIFLILTGIGAGISVTILYRMFLYPVTAAIENYHIAYHLHFPIVVRYLGASCYFIATVIPTFFSSVRRMRLLGVLILLSYIVALVFYTKYAISVWCFFSAAISVVIYFIMRSVKNPPEIIPE